MALDTKALKVLDSLATPFPATAGPGYRVPRLLAYATPDTLAAVTAAGYFDAAGVSSINAPALLVGDVLVIQHTVGGATGVALRAVTAIAGGAVTIAVLG